MIISTTLMGIACLIANPGSVDTSSLEAQLNDAEMVQVQEFIESGGCLPEQMETLLKETQEKVKQGHLPELQDGQSPSHDCG